MTSAPLPRDDDARLAALRAYGIVDGEDEPAFDEIVRLAAQVCRVPMAAITLVDAERTWFKARIGFDQAVTPRELSFCAHAVDADELFVVENAAEDERFKDNPMVTGAPHVRFYAGAPLITPEGQHIGVLCAAGSEPRKLRTEQAEGLRWLARDIVMLLELRRRSAEREKAESALRVTASLSRSPQPVDTTDRWRFWPAILALLGGLLLTALAARIAHQLAIQGEKDRFTWRAERIAADIGDRLRNDVGLADAAAALWTPQHQPTARDWDTFFKKQTLGGRFRGVAGLGFVEVVPPSELAAFNARGKAEYGDGFNASLEGDVLYAIRMLAPAEIARAGIGFNIASQQGRRVTAETARDEGRAVMTPPTNFDGRQLNAIIYRPVYRPGLTLDTVEERRAAHIGWVYELVFVTDLIDQLPLDTAMRFQLFDGSNRLYATGTDARPLPFRSQRRMSLFGRGWIALIEGSPDERIVRRETQMVLVAGVPITLLLVVMVVVLNSTRRRALAIAGDMTRGLRDSELRIRSIVDHVADAVIAFHDDGKLAAFNPAAERLFGYRPSDIIGRQVATILPTIRDTAADGTSVQTRAHRSDGSEIPVDLAVKPVPGDDSNLTVAIVRDISERVANEERLRASEERYRDLFENSNDLIQSVDAQSRFLVVNRAWFRTLGYSESELRTMKLSDILDAEVKVKSAEQRAMPVPWCALPAETAVPGGECLHCENVETIFRARDGRRVHVEGNMSCRFDDRGRPLSTRGLWRDITARKRGEQELRAAQERLESLIENADDVIYRADARGRFTFVNATASRLTGYGKDELIGMSYLKLVRPDYRDAVKEFYEQQHSGKAANSYLEFPIITADGQEMWLGQKVQPVFEHGEIIGYHGLARDVTDRKQLKDELVLARDAALESVQLKSQFLATMSHEIRTPMNGVIGMLALLLETELSAEQREIATTVQTSADSLLTIINDILDYSKIESGKLIFERNEFDLIEVIDGSVDLLAEQARSKSLQIAVVVEPDVPTNLRGDAGRLRQVLINLIGNAVKFTAEGSIVVAASMDGETESEVLVRFTVSDSGVGIEPEVVERLFTPFVQADGSMARRFGGTGLGLAICKQLVEQMNGEIGVESEPGQGSTFWFTAELEKQPPASREAQPIAPAMPVQAQQMRVLVAEDNRVNQKVVVSQLRKLGHTAVAVGNGLEALAALDEIDYDAVLMDCQMPEMDGYEAATIIRRRRRYKKLPIIAMTAHAMAGDRERCLDAGMDDYITKPFKTEQLAAVLSRVSLPAEAAEAAAVDDDGVLDESVLAELRAIGSADPAFVSAVIGLYLQEAPGRVDALRRAIDAGDHEAMWRTAHGFKGACANVGARRLVELCAAIERQGRSGWPDGAATLFETLESEFHAAAAALEQVRTQ
ncbi:MAG TPA: PAS domain S-box protein [Thermoanaerobaculia bacterium]|nr:PAS domain S-box protein [Thermoanaerobaculia bacterium]